MLISDLSLIQVGCQITSEPPGVTVETVRIEVDIVHDAPSNLEIKLIPDNDTLFIWDNDYPGGIQELEPDYFVGRLVNGHWALSVYDEARKISEDRMALWLETISKHVSGYPVKTIIDLGCGTGRFLKALADHFSAKIYGIDPSWKMLTVAQSIPDSTMITLIQGVAEYIPLGNDSTDLVFISQAYHHIQNKHIALSEIKHILKPGGFLCIRNSTRECLDTYIHLRFFPQALKSDHELLPSRNEVVSLLQDIGFEFKGHDIVNQKFAENVKEYLTKIKLKNNISWEIE